MKVKSLSRVRLFRTPWMAAYQAPPPMGFSRQEYWSRVPLPSLPGLPIHHQLLEFTQISRSDQISLSVMSDSLRPHESQHARPPCPSPTPGVCPNLRQLCHPAISSSVIRFSSCPPSLPASGSFPMSQLFTSGGQLQLQHQTFQ